MDGFLINKKWGFLLTCFSTCPNRQKTGFRGRPLLWSCRLGSWGHGWWRQGRGGCCRQPHLAGVAGNRSGVSALRTVLADQEPVAQGSYLPLSTQVRPYGVLANSSNKGDPVSFQPGTEAAVASGTWTLRCRWWVNFGDDSVCPIECHTHEWGGCWVGVGDSGLDRHPGGPDVKFLSNNNF